MNTQSMYCRTLPSDALFSQRRKSPLNECPLSMYSLRHDHQNPFTSHEKWLLNFSFTICFVQRKPLTILIQYVQYNALIRTTLCSRDCTCKTGPFVRGLSRASFKTVCSFVFPLSSPEFLSCREVVLAFL